MKFLSLIIVLALVMLVVSSPLPKNDSADGDSKDLKAESKDSKDDSKNSKAESADSKGDSKDSKDDSKKSKDDSKDVKAESADSKGDSKNAGAAAAGASVLKSQKYNDFEISDGVAGKAEEEATALFKDINRNNLAATSEEDLKRIKAVHDVAEDAEVEAFNPAVKSATGPDAEAIQAGKIKNKVLKLEATVLALQIEEAKGKNVADKLAVEEKKLKKNISLDIEKAGKPTKGVPFDGTT
ncbi:putative small secreted protein [Golovinomyces cichoracearum]|uniref:Putative small secreted protein n=1 Tax=Golovinomyces cichoracearum TaxID=62708 RepID=A0A420IUF1_9PEZI|nr:putative small secreted protein [Golovinomyces cichoracearum]